MRKKFGTLLIVSGFVALALGIYGFIILSDSHHFAGAAYDYAIPYIDLGGNLDDGLYFDLFIVGNRFLVAIAGAAGLIVGSILRSETA